MLFVREAVDHAGANPTSLAPSRPGALNSIAEPVAKRKRVSGVIGGGHASAQKSVPQSI